MGANPVDKLVLSIHIFGIWCEANRPIQFNGDLLDRITEFPVEPWSADDFKKVIKKNA